jgi:hypothetical protein
LPRAALKHDGYAVAAGWRAARLDGHDTPAPIGKHNLVVRAQRAREARRVQLHPWVRDHVGRLRQANRTRTSIPDLLIAYLLRERTAPAVTRSPDSSRITRAPRAFRPMIGTPLTASWMTFSCDEVSST